MGMVHETFDDLMEDVAAARDDAEDVARREAPRCVIRQRMTEFVACARGEKLTEGGCWEWRPNEADTERTIQQLIKHFPEAEAIYIEGGFDAGQSVRFFYEDDYTPWVSEFAVTVWTKED